MFKFILCFAMVISTRIIFCMQNETEKEKAPEPKFFYRVKKGENIKYDPSWREKLLEQDCIKARKDQQSLNALQEILQSKQKIS